MLNRVVNSLDDALAGVSNGASVLVAGFGDAGRADGLLQGLLDRGIGDLTVYSNNAGSSTDPLGALVREGRISKLVCTYPRSMDSEAPIYEAWRSKRIEVELVPQGTLAERIRAGGAGIGAFFTPTGADTELTAGKETRTIAGVTQVLEYAITADVALAYANVADRWGNLRYRRAARNFNPIMLTAARLSIVETARISPTPLDPELVETPGIFVDRVFKTGLEQRDVD